MSKQKFEVERLLLFSDAVFAIIITLMIIEVKPPHLHAGNDFKSSLHDLSEVFPNIIGTILSFWLIGNFWVKHHKHLTHLINYDNKLMWHNLFLLLSLAFIPFSTGFVFENLSLNSILPLIVYNINYIIATLISISMYSYLGKYGNTFYETPSEFDIRVEKFQNWFSIIIYTIVLVVNIFNPRIAPIFYALFGLMNFFENKWYRK